MNPGDIYIRVRPGELPVRFEVTKVSKSAKWVELTADGSTIRESLPLEPFYFKVDE